MATTKAKKTALKRTPAKKALTKKAPAKKPSNKKTVRSTTAGRRPFITRSDEYTQLTWVLISIWLVLIAIFLGTVRDKTA